MPRKKTKSSSAKPGKKIEAVKHKDKRVNIPTKELEDFMREDEAAPKTMLYPRDPSLDPQLVWKGKDELDASDLEVPVVPIYIQEKISPQALIEDLRLSYKRERAPQASLFDDFNGIEFEELVDFYRHEQNWSNRMILGDSLLVMSSLAEKENLKGKVQMIYIDPPYGIKFGSNWQVSTRKRDVKDGKAADATREPEQIKAFRDTWKLGIHSYLTYLRDRLTVARELLTETGSIFVQIGDENVHLVRCLMDEVFGSENFVSLIAYATSTGRTAQYISNVNDYVIWYGKSYDKTKYRSILTEKKFERDSESDTELGDLTSQGAASGSQPFEFRGQVFHPSAARHWSNDHVFGMPRLDKAGRITQVSSTQIRAIKYLSDNPVIALGNRWIDTQLGAFSKEKVYVVQTSSKIIQRCLLMTTDPGDLVLDPTCGSGTTAYVAERWGRRWITIDTSRVALALARTRLMSAKYPYYLLSDSTEGLQKEAELGGEVLETGTPGYDIRKGFVYKRVPHITLKSIANNEEIDVIHAKWQPELEDLLARINKACKAKWHEWEVPREVPEGANPLAEVLIPDWWETRRKRQKEIDETIARHGAMETLYDQPYEDRKRIRVSGPFTTESLSPHRVLAADIERTEAEREAERTPGAGQFELMILDNLRKSGVQNRIKNERLKFDRLESFAGTWIHGEGEYTEKETGKVRRVAVCIGPEHGTVGTELIREAAKEAVKGVGFEILVVCGFAFESRAGEEAKEYGNLVVLPAKMNPDLSMGDELLKKTGSGNLFMVFGEPDIEITEGKDGRFVAEIRGVDVYDPTTGQLRSDSTDDIACWFIDTDYNGESFFVRHAYFLGADEPYKKLKKALRAEIDESAWSELYSAKSRPFDVPKKGKIAIKVINHFGDEIMKVYQL